MLNWIRNKQPALVGGLVTAMLTLAVAFGADLSGEQVGAISALAVALMALAVRSQVHSADTVERKVNTAAFDTASQLTSETAGTVGQVTEAAGQVVHEVVGGLL